ncbi:AAA family ATPase [Rubrobacter aplysinae]|uniref:AAA family ATPase n=1 Tax=Rubrobacter aplysinae TaxID=909625 RepID=UPI00064BAB9F|nr:SMC family ATPase [Rubrobacter aplysinae]
MNLERLYIQNYKQLREPIELRPPEGAIGVIGANGTGKSSLFESILWAFFGTRSGDQRISNALIPWSGGSTKDPTVVEATLSIGGRPYTVRRQLRSGQTTAEAKDPDGSVVVSGASDVTKWAQAHLLGMDRTAFEATFFARQKELKFFAQDDGISRVRRVSRMLGINSVEDAQKLLRDDRNGLRAEARSIESRLEEADVEGHRRELEEAQTESGRIEEELEKVSTRHDEAAAELEADRQKRRALEESYRKHVEATNRLRQAGGERDRAADRAENARKTLAELSEAESELSGLKPEAERLPGVEEELAWLEEERQKAERLERAREERKESQTALARAESGLWKTLDGLDDPERPEPLSGWNDLFGLEGERFFAESVRVLGLAAGELDSAEGRLSGLERLREDHAALSESRAESERLRERHEAAQTEVERLEAEIGELSGGEDLEEREKALREEAETLRELSANRRGTANSLEQEAKNVEKAREAIERGAEEHCPTCHRPFDEGEQDEILESLTRQASGTRNRAEKSREEAARHAADAERAEERLQRVGGLLKRWRGLREELSSARSTVSDRRESLAEAQKRVSELEESLAGEEPPEEEHLTEARACCEELRALRDALPGVKSLAREHEEQSRRLEKVKTEIQSLSEVAYDAEAHRAKQQEKTRLERAAGRAEELERRLATRPQVEETLAEAEKGQREAEDRAEAVKTELAELAFDEREYAAAGERVTESEKRVAELRDERERLGGEWKDADNRIGRAKAELKRLDDDRKLANRRSAEAARMDEMDGLFTEFFRGLTSRVRPALEAEASDLIRELTDGRYESMEFDDNYRVKLVDRFDDSYPVERFSGGEADVASLSARVALSKIIAQKSTESLGFLVLDEVFGSLDADRRSNVLMALERLKRSFGQIFIISHVGEVQESALMDEVWNLEEDDEGRSTVKRVEQGTGAGEVAEALG